METAIVSNKQAYRGPVNRFAPFATKHEGGEHTLTYLVEGMHCASCIQLIENALTARPEVTYARVNMSTHRLKVTWQGEADVADALAQTVINLGYSLKPFDAASEKQSTSEEKFLLRCIAIAAFAMGNIMLISAGLWAAGTDTMGVQTRGLFHWLSALIALPAIFYAGRPFFHSAWSVLAQKRTNMDVPISLALILTTAMSLHEVVTHGEHIYFDSAVMLCFFLLIGRYLDTRAKDRARQTATELLSMLHGTATTLTKCGHQKTIPIRELREGMTVLVAAGEQIPGDGTITQGVSEIDMSMITGETLPAVAKEGMQVFAGTINLSGPLTIEISKASGDSLLSDIVKWMEHTEQGQAHYVRLADKAARLYTPIVHTLGLMTFLGWWQLGGMEWQSALLIAVTVLIITCPCALGLAVPVVQVLASSQLMKHGILLKSGDALERLAQITTVVFDKTGTLTLGKPTLMNASAHKEKKMALLASLAAHSKHPLSRALLEAYDGELLPVKDVEEVAGSGLCGVVNGTSIRLGNAAWCDTQETLNDAYLHLWYKVDNEPAICIYFADTLKEDAGEIVSQFTRQRLHTALISGDREPVVVSVANTLGISDYSAAISPIDKCHAIERLKPDHHVLMVGDGLNDAPALAAAHVSMSPASAIDITQNTADIVFQGDKLMPVITVWRVAKESTKLVKQNFALAVLYNLCAIPLAVMGYVTPLIAALAMSGSSLLVIGNSFRLREGNR